MRGNRMTDFFLEPIAEVDSHDEVVYHMALAPQGGELVCAIQAHTYVFSIVGNLDSLEEKTRFQTDFHGEPASQFQSVCRFSSAGEWYGTGGEDGTVRIWSYPSLSLHSCLSRHKHNDTILAIDFKGCDSDRIRVG